MKNIKTTNDKPEKYFIENFNHITKLVRWNILATNDYKQILNIRRKVYSLLDLCDDEFTCSEKVLIFKLRLESRLVNVLQKEPNYNDSDMTNILTNKDEEIDIAFLNYGRIMGRSEITLEKELNLYIL